MTTRLNFSRAYVEKELDAVALKLRQKTKVYVAGGAAMALINLKEATKDIDVVVESEAEVKSLLLALEQLGYKDPHGFVTINYQRMHARAIRENADGFRWDMFEKVIAGKLSLSKDMIERARGYARRPGMLQLSLLAKEDIFLLKSITEREGDLDDMRVIAESTVDWKIIAGECRWQSDNSNTVWESALCDRLEALRTKHGITTPIEKEICRSAKRKILSLAKTKKSQKASGSGRG